MIQALIVDDEPVARRRIRRLLTGEADVVVVGETGDGRSAIDAIRTAHPNLVFLDVQMPEADGFEVVRTLGPAMPEVVFVTAFDHYALSAFEVHALDYLLKPFNRARFLQSVTRARAALAAPDDTAVHKRLSGLLADLRVRSRYLNRFVVRTPERVLLVDASQVDWIEAADNYAILHAGRSSHVVRDTMSRLASELDPQRFIRIHRSTIVQIDRVRELLPAFHGDYVVLLHDGTRLTLSRNYRSGLEEVLRRAL
jgi:two-component system, LytTR family, response regulator